MSEETIDLRYDLYSLPTAQHKAGLAGLCVLHDTLRRRKIGPLPEIVFPEEGIVRLSLTKATLETLFNDLYDAAYKETPRRKPLKDKNKNELKCLREEIRKETDPKTGKEKEVTFYIYEDVVPKCAFLDSLQASEPWLKLWRDALWNTLRVKPTTRNPYKQRANGTTVKEVDKAWESLQKYKKNPLTTEEIAGTIYIGVQDSNAEKVPFKGRTDENFLLHFWPIVMRVFVPEIINNKGETEFKKNTYVLAIPEVCNIEGFVEDFSPMVSQLKMDLKGYRPAESVISVPQEGALEYIAALVRNKAQDGNLAYNISSIEVVHLERRSKDAVMLSSSRLTVDDAVRGKYESIRSGHYRHPLFKLQIIRNLLDGKDWYSGFDRAFSSHDKDWFLGFKTWFPVDVRSHFKLMNQ